MIPGEYILRPEPIELNAAQPRVRLRVDNHGDRPVQVGSHAHFFEVNRYLRFDRALAFGMRLDIPSGTAMRFEPGDEKDVTMVEFGGAHVAKGMNGLTREDTRSAWSRDEAMGR